MLIIVKAVTSTFLWVRSSIPCCSLVHGFIASYLYFSAHANIYHMLVYIIYKWYKYIWHIYKWYNINSIYINVRKDKLVETSRGKCVAADVSTASAAIIKANDARCVAVASD